MDWERFPSYVSSDKSILRDEQRHFELGGHAHNMSQSPCLQNAIANSRVCAGEDESLQIERSRSTQMQQLSNRLVSSARSEALNGFYEGLVSPVPVKFLANPDPPLYNHAATPILLSSSGVPHGLTRCTSVGRRNASGPIIEALHLLKLQIMNAGGVEVRVPPSDFISSVAVIASYSSIWIAGFKSGCLRLHGLLHVGDQVMSVNGMSVSDVSTLHKHLTQLAKVMPVCALRLRRLPLAKVFAVKRDAPGQSVGLRVQPKHAVALVDPNGLAALSGLPSLAKSYLGQINLTADYERLTTWSITEINNRRINLFGSEKDLNFFLNCDGNEVTMVVQPTDFVDMLRKHVKTIRGYKAYLS